MTPEQWIICGFALLYLSALFALARQVFRLANKVERFFHYGDRRTR